MTSFFSRRQPLSANLRSRTVGKILYIVLRDNHMLGCQFSHCPSCRERLGEKVHQNLLLPFEDNIEGGPENKGNQQYANEPQDCTLTVSDDGVPGTDDVLTEPKPVGEGDAICVQCVNLEKS